MQLDPMVADWLREGPEHGPRHGLERALAEVRYVDQRPGWTFPRRWLPRWVADIQLRLPVPAGATLILLLTLLLLVALAAAYVATRPPPVRLPVVPPGMLIAYEQAGAIYVSRADGSDRAIVSNGVDHAHSPAFSPDGRLVAFLSAEGGESLGGRLMVVPVDASVAAVEVSEGLQVLANEVSQFSWSPGSDQLAFAAQQDGVARIFVAATDGAGATAITDAAADRDLPSWSPDGDWIAHRVTEPDGLRRHLQLIRPDGSDLQQVATVIAEDAHLSRLAWSPATQSFSYATSFGFGTPTRAVIDHGFQHTVEPWTEGVGGYADGGVPFSPDGNYLAILTANDGLVIADFDPTGPEYEGNLRRLGGVLDCWVQWSPDGATLLGGSPGDCTSVVAVPLADPAAALTLPVSDLAVALPGGR